MNRIRKFDSGRYCAALYLFFVFTTHLSAREEPDFPDLVYAVAGSDTLKLDLYLPQLATGPVPLIVWIHGGGWMAGDKASVIRVARVFVPRGFAVAGISYRFSEVAHYPAQLHDCKAAIRWLRAHASIFSLDPEHIGVGGESAGGHLAALLGTTGDVPYYYQNALWMNVEGKVGDYTAYSSQVQAVCDLFGPTDFLRMNDFPGTVDHNAPDSPESRLIGGPIQDFPDRCTLANPITFISPEDPPFLLMHGTADSVVPLDQSERLYAGLKRAYADTDTELTFYRVAVAGHGHGAFDGDSLLHLAADFFDRNLRDRDRISALPVVRDEAPPLVYPVPARHKAWLLLNPAAPATATLDLYDSSARKLRTVILSLLPEGPQRVPLPLAGIESGVYFLRLRLGKKVTTLPLLLAP